MDSVADTTPPLQAISEKGEQIVGLVPTGDWPRIYAYIADINDMWVGYTNGAMTPGPQSEPLQPTAATLQSRVAAALGGLKDAAATRDPPKTIRTAQDLAGAASDLYEYYHAAIPPEFHRLEVLERQVLFDLSSDGYDSASRVLKEAEEAWQHVQPAILERAGFGATQAIGGELKVQRTAIDDRDRATAINSVETMLSLINGVQRLY